MRLLSTNSPAVPSPLAGIAAQEQHQRLQQQQQSEQTIAANRQLKPGFHEELNRDIDRKHNQILPSFSGLDIQSHWTPSVGRNTAGEDHIFGRSSVMDSLWSAFSVFKPAPSGRPSRGPQRSPSQRQAPRIQQSHGPHSPIRRHSSAVPNPPSPSASQYATAEYLSRATTSHRESFAPPPVEHADTSDSSEGITLAIPMSSLDAVTTLSVVQDSLFIGTKSGAVVEWDVDNQTVIRTYQPTPEDEALLEGEESSESKSTECAAVTALTCSSRKIISGSADGALRVWSVATGACARSLLAAQKGAVTALTHTPEGRLYSAGADGIINEWDARSLRKKWMLNGHSGAVTMLYAGPSGSGRLFSAGSDHTIRVWDLNTGRCLVTYQEHNDAVLSLCLGRDLLYSGAQDGAIHVMDVNTGQCLRVLRGHAGAVRSLCLAKGKLYSCGDDGHVIAWDVKAARMTRKMAAPGVVALCAGASGKLFAGTVEARVYQWTIAAPAVEQLTIPVAAEDELAPTRSTSSATHSSGAGDMGRPRPQSMMAQLTPAAHSGSPPSLHRRSTLSSRAPSAVSAVEDVNLLKEQLAKAQELISHQNRQKLRLKGELAATRTEFARLRADFAATQDAFERATQAEDELGAAKDLLVTYKMELSLTQEAQESALDYITRTAGRSRIEMEHDLLGLHALLAKPIPVHPLLELRELETFKPPKPTEKCWETDSEYDSDVDIDDLDPWWERLSDDVLQVPMEELARRREEKLLEQERGREAWYRPSDSPETGSSAQSNLPYLGEPEYDAHTESSRSSRVDDLSDPRKELRRTSSTSTLGDINDILQKAAAVIVRKLPDGSIMAAAGALLGGEGSKPQNISDQDSRLSRFAPSPSASAHSPEKSDKAFSMYAYPNALLQWGAKVTRSIHETSP